jgi:hypothetical protein
MVPAERLALKYKITYKNSGENSPLKLIRQT